MGYILSGLEAFGFAYELCVSVLWISFTLRWEMASNPFLSVMFPTMVCDL